MSNSSTRSLAVFATGLTAVTYVLLVFGSAVRVHGAGLACPDWPLCFGEVVPAFDFQVYMEFGHRVLAGLVSLGFLGMTFRILRDERLRARMWPLSLLAAVALGSQVVLGGLTVLELLAEWTVASHLVTGNTFCLLLLVHALTLWDIERGPERAPVSVAQRGVAGLLLLLVPAQLVLGGLVAASHAGLACGTWPGCNGDVWFPTFEGLIGLQVTHRIVAYTLLGAGLLNLAVQGVRGRAGKAAVLVFAAILVQASIGVANVLLRMPVEVTLAHSAGAAAIVLSTTWLHFELWRAPLAQTSTNSASSPVDAIAVEGR
ncbi:MAG: heme A synthase [Deltaproteobacteria bacterium]|nr:MAG: heme A synthase [Deltaproteobacteria bacterium]